MKRLLLTICALLLLLASLASAEITPPTADTVLATLRQEHPRLMLDNAGLDALKKTLETDATAQGYYRDVIQAADAFLDEPTLTYEVREGYRIMSVSRQCIRRMYALGLAWRLTGDAKYAEKAERDLLAVCGFENWTPSLVIIYPLQPKHKVFEKKHGRAPWSFLDVSEMCHAVGIGYDWFYDALPESSRRTIRAALIEKGLSHGVAAYTGKGKEDGRKDDWTTYNHNWNLVCNGGLVVGALAIAESDPEYASVVIPGAVESLPLALTTYGPDGAWPEGPGYWSYATNYAVYGLAAMQSALGTDYGLSEIEGLSETGNFPLLTSGPAGLYVNYADSSEKAARKSIPCLFWLARNYSNSFFSDQEHVMAAKEGANPLHLIWYMSPSGENAPDLDFDSYFRGPTEVAVFRSALNDPDALFAGVKAGDNTFNHAQLDLGTFELDALGVRWARDLGRDDYALPGYFDFYYLTGKLNGQRWSYYRNATESHNVPLINGRGQDELATASVVLFASDTSSANVVIDLSRAYAHSASKVLRGIAIVGDRRALLVQDEFTFTADTEVQWGMTTDADIAVDGASATLRLDDRELVARILEPQGAVFSAESAEQEPPDARNEGVRRLVLRVQGTEGFTSVAVLLSPVWTDKPQVKTVAVVPLSEWK